jgi:hypothetical protein
LNGDPAPGQLEHDVVGRVDPGVLACIEVEPPRRVGGSDARHLFETEVVRDLEPKLRQIEAERDVGVDCAHPARNLNLLADRVSHSRARADEFAEPLQAHGQS